MGESGDREQGTSFFMGNAAGELEMAIRALASVLNRDSPFRTERVRFDQRLSVLTGDSPF